MTMPSTEKSSESLHHAAALLKKSQRPLLISHPRPDGDTIGSALALRLALIQLGKTPQLACIHPIPETLVYLPGAETYINAAPDDAKFDTVVAVDLSDLGRTGGIYQETWRVKFPLLVIDHHETNDNFGDVNLVDPRAAATALPMAALINALGITLDSDMATSR